MTSNSETCDAQDQNQPPPATSHEIGGIALSLRVPPFWRDRPRLWFISFEAATHDLRKSQAQLAQMVIAQLDKQDVEQISDLLYNPPSEHQYHTLKERLISVYEESEGRQFQKLLQEMELGDQKPTQLLRRMRNLARDKVSDSTLRLMWMNHLPPHVRSVLVVSDTISKTAALDELALLADKMLEQNQEVSAVSTSSSSNISSHRMDSQLLLEEIRKLSLEVAELKSRHTYRNHQRLWTFLILRMWTIALIICISLITSECQDLKKLNNVFSESIREENLPSENATCIDIHGSIRGCHDCYLCSEPQITERKDRPVIVEISMIDSTCKATDICCIPQTSLVAREGRENCGKINAEGYYPAVRDSLRSVLPGEYPWRAWVYSSVAEDVEPLCAATYIDFEALALITTASCVSPYKNDKLYIRFSKSAASLEVDKKIIHEKYKFYYNDIAILTLKSLETDLKPGNPKWAAPCCLPTETPRFGTPCIAVSGDDYYINAGIPNEKYCRVEDVPMHESHMCAVAPRYDYTPETGSALICLEEREKHPTYSVFGIALRKSGEEITIYTNVTHFSDWIDKHVDNKKEDKNQGNRK